MDDSVEEGHFDGRFVVLSTEFLLDDAEDTRLKQLHAIVVVLGVAGLGGLGFGEVGLLEELLLLSLGKREGFEGLGGCEGRVSRWGEHLGSGIKYDKFARLINLKFASGSYFLNAEPDQFPRRAWPVS